MANVAIAEAQLRVVVSEAGANQVNFQFYNDGLLASSITDIYFDDGTLLGIAEITSGDVGVSFSQLAKPRDLPAGNLVSFNTTADFSADSDPAVQPNGVNPGETIGILFDLLDGQTYDDTVAALFLDPTDDGSLRIGIHVQGLEYDDGSESLVNNASGLST